MLCHLEFQKIVDSFKDINLYKYAAYRTALKIQRLQKACKFHLIDLNVITNTLEKNPLHQRDIKNLISWEDAELMICSLYETAKRQIGFVAQPETLAHIFLSFLSSAFCLPSSNLLLLHQLRVVLILFSAAKLADKRKFIFQQFAYGGYISKENLHLLLTCLAKITEALGEKLTFGTNFVMAAVKSCLQFANETKNVHELAFLEWFSHEPQTLVWMSTHYRLCVSEKVEHNAKCNVCKCHPIIGLRYKCLCCFRYNLCEQCFLRGYVNRGHQSKHPVQEFCQLATHWEETKTTLLTIRNKLLFSPGWKQNFLAYEKDPNTHSEPKPQNEVVHLKENLIELPNCNSAIPELSSIIEKLQEEYQQICNEIERTETPDLHSRPFNGNANLERWILLRKEALQEHSYHLQLQLQRLQRLLVSLKSSSDKCTSSPVTEFFSPLQNIPRMAMPAHPFESTPLAEKNILTQHQNLSNFIRIQAELDGFKDFSKATDFLGMRQTALYSLADIEMDDLSQPASNSHPISKLTNEVQSNIESSEDLSTKMFSTLQNVCSVNKMSHDNQKSNIFNPVIAVPNNVSLKTMACDSVEQKMDKEQSKHSQSSMSNLLSDDNCSVEYVETELQSILEHMENLCPKVTDLQNSLPLQKDKFLCALTEMEEALKKLSATITDDENSRCYDST